MPRSAPLARVTIVGRGRLGGALLRALSAAGVKASALAGSSLPAGAVPTLRTATLVLLAVPDDAMKETAARLAPALGGETPVVLHLSGSLDHSALEPLRSLGAPTGSCHPLQSFPLAGTAAHPFRGVVFALEGDSQAVAAGRALAAALGGKPREIGGRARALYHLAATWASGGAVALLGASRDALVAAGFSESEALEALAPLLRTAFETALERGPEEALTGPVARDDRETLERHRRALRAWDARRLALYEALVAEQRRLATPRRR